MKVSKEIFGKMKKIRKKAFRKKKKEYTQSF